MDSHGGTNISHKCTKSIPDTFSYAGDRILQIVKDFCPTYNAYRSFPTSVFYRSNYDMKRTSSLEGRTNAKNAPKGAKSTIMILVMITVFTMLKMPICVDVIFAQYIPGDPTNAWYRWPLRVLARTLTFANSAVNFLIYLASGKQFRNHLARMFSRLSGGIRRRMGGTAQSSTGKSNQTAATTD